MPGPFPGMDPYLEHPGLWPGVHQGIISSARAILNTILPPRFVADMGERLYLLQPDRNVYPDVLVLEQPQTFPQRRTGAATAAVIDRPWTISAAPEEIRETFVQILTATEPERVVTVIEVLSFSNKAAGTHGRKLYRDKQRELFQSDTSLIEIDLLRTGEHTVLAPRHRLLEQGTWDYLTSLHRAGAGWEFEAWPTQLRERLPRIAVPLGGEYPDVALDLQQVFDRVYDEGAYVRRVDYSREAPVSLSTAEADWADGLLREQGYRTS